MINFHTKMEETLRELEASGRTPKLLLHSCCAPCSSYVLELLASRFLITVFYYNPNIYPEEEFFHRREEQRQFIRRFSENNPALHPIAFEAGEYDSDRFYEIARGLEDEPERGARCEACFRLRLSAAAVRARELAADYFCTTLSISPMKDAVLLNALGEQIAGEYGVDYLYSDFKKKNGYLRSTQLSKEYGIYRQDYCGCVFSKREREQQIVTVQVP